MERKKILITIDWFLPGTKSGGPVRSYANMMDHLGKFHDFYIITRDTDYCSDAVYEGIKSNEWNQFNDHTSIYYFSNDNLKIDNLKKLLKETDFEIAYVNGIYSWYFSIVPLWFLRDGRTTIVAARGMLNPQAFSVKGFKKKTFLAISKLLGLYRQVVFHATNNMEAEHIKGRIGQETTVKIAPNFPRILDSTTIKTKQKHSPTRFVTVARISIEKGILKMIEALQNVRGDMILDIYGPIYDAAYWKKCKKEIQNLPTNVILTYKGVLASEAVMDTLEAYDFFVLLSEGENFGHAILEAFMSGCPVIISDKTPWTHLTSKKVGWDISLNKPSIIESVFESAIAMTPSVYNAYSVNAVNFSKAFSQDPELLRLNLQLFD